jgi:hypothetical protein
MTLFGSIVVITTIGSNVATMFGVTAPNPLIAIPTPTATETITPTQTLAPTATLIPSPEPSGTPAIVVLSAPVIDSIEFPQSINCNGQRYDVPIRFHDLDGDAHRVQWELLYSKKQTPLFSDAVEFFIDSQEQIDGATFHDFLEWYIPGDEVKIRVYIEDRAKQTGFMDFEFKCSQ